MIDLERLTKGATRRTRPRYLLAAGLLGAFLLLPWSIATYRGQQAKATTIREIQALNGLAVSRYHFRVAGLRNIEFGPIETVVFQGPLVSDGNLEILRKRPSCGCFS